jgi:hypothetical protein
MVQLEGNNGVRGGQGYEGVRGDVKPGFFQRNVNPLLHLELETCKIRAEPFAFSQSY